MNQLFALLKKELKSYIDHPMAYILVVVFFVLNSFLYFRSGLSQEVASLRSMFSLLPWIFIFFISALTMRTWAEERKEKTLSVLLSYPVAVWKLILGKFLATWLFVVGTLLLTLSIPMALSSAGEFDWGVVFSQYLGATLLAAVMVAIGQWVSTLTKNQVVAFILSAAIQTGFFLIGLEVVVISLSYPLNAIAQQLGVLSHVNAMARGVIDIRDILYFVSVTAVFLGLAYAWVVKAKTLASSAYFKKLQTSLILFIGIAVVVNLFGQSYTVRADLTEQNIYSLSVATKTVLQDLDDTVNISLFRSQKLPTQVELVGRDVQDILNDYAKFGGRYVDLAIKYPDQDEEVAQEAQSAGIPSVQFNVHREDEFTLQDGYLGIALQYVDKTEVIPFVGNINDLEYQLTRAILKMQGQKQLRLGFMQDFGGQDLESLPSFSQSIRQDYLVENINLEVEEGEEVTEIDPSIDILVIAGPTQPLTEAALSQIQAYVDSGGKIFWMLSGMTIDDATLNGAVNETGLESILAQQGIVVNKDVVADLASHQNVSFGNGVVNYILPYPYWVVAGLQKHQLAGNVSQVMLPWPSSLSYEESAFIEPLSLSTQNSASLSESFTLNPNALPDFNSFEQEQKVLALTVSEVGRERGRWVVVGSERFLSEQIVSQSPQNIGLALNALDWLAQNDALLSIRSKNAQPNTLVWESKEKQKWAVWGNTLGIPVLVVLIGGVWIYRRKKLTKQSL